MCSYRYDKIVTELIQTLGTIKMRYRNDKSDQILHFLWIVETFLSKYLFTSNFKTHLLPFEHILCYWKLQIHSEQPGDINCTAPRFSALYCLLLRRVVSKRVRDRFRYGIYYDVKLITIIIIHIYKAPCFRDID
jgi:hypothetical protein